MLRALLKLLGIGLNTLVVAPLVVAVATVDEHRAYHLCRLWVRINLLLSRVRIRARRRTDLDPAASYVFMSNHVSHFDVLAVVEALPDYQLRWVAKRELTRIPVFGWALARTGHIVIDRSDRAQSIASLKAAGERMASGISVMIFPEGTRAPPGDGMLPFKKGGFALAQEANVPIVPIAVRGSGGILPRGSRRILAGTIDVEVGAPILEPALSREELMDRVADAMRAMLEAA